MRWSNPNGRRSLELKLTETDYQRAKAVLTTVLGTLPRILTDEDLQTLQGRDPVFSDRKILVELLGELGVSPLP